MSSYNQALIDSYKKESEKLSPDDYAFLYTLIEEEATEEEVGMALLALRRLKERVM